MRENEEKAPSSSTEGERSEKREVKNEKPIMMTTLHFSLLTLHFPLLPSGRSGGGFGFLLSQ